MQPIKEILLQGDVPYRTCTCTYMYELGMTYMYIHVHEKIACLKVSINMRLHHLQEEFFYMYIKPFNL